MTIRKGKPLPLEKPSNMQRVLLAVGHGCRNRREVMDETKLQEGQVRSALHNLVFIGLLHRHRDEHGRSIYMTPGQWHNRTPACFIRVASIFHARFTDGQD